MGRTGWGAAVAFLIVVAASCSSAPIAKPSPSRDISDARPIARAVAEILLNYSAYDYALVGSLNGERIRAVNADRYASVVREQAALIADTSTKIVAAVVDTTGPIHDRLVALADTLGELRRDSLAQADAKTPEAFVKVLDDVARSWSLLRSLESLLRDDGTLDKIIERGTGMKVTATPSSGALVTVGPFAGGAEASDRAKELGSSWTATTESPFVARASYKDRASADAAATALLKQGTVAIVIDQTSYKFSRSGAAPDVELWREPERFLDGRAGSRRVALTANASHVAIGSDDGYVAIFTNDGVLRSLPRFNAGVNQLVFTDDGRFLFGGGQTLVTWVMPRPTDSVGVPMRLRNAAQSVVFIPKAYAFAASSPGEDDEGGIIGGRAPDGVPLSDPFPMELSSSGAILGASDNGELFIATQVGGIVELRVLNVGRERNARGVTSVAGTLRAFTVDRTGTFGAIITDQGAFRFSIKAPDPSKTITKVAPAARDVEFGKDGTLYVLEQQRLTAVSTEGTAKWSATLVDGRALVAATRPVVLDGTDRVVAFAADGTADVLAPVGQLQDLVASRDGNWIAVIADGRRAVLFHLQ